MSVCSRNQSDQTLIINGLVPDGVTAVEITTADGKVLTSTAVSLNTFRLDLGKSAVPDAAQLRWVGVEGGLSIDELLPDDLSC